MTYKEWLDNEYAEWVKALQESTVHNFKEHPIVKRMLGIIDTDLFWPYIEKMDAYTWEKITAIEDIGDTNGAGYLPGACYRMIYYAQQILKRNPSSICEIGGGVGQFYAILRALGWKGEYWIFDLPEVQSFQKLYLSEVTKQTGLNLHLSYSGDQVDMIASFYALGEFDDSVKKKYEVFINDCSHGYIVWNPHSGASDDLSIFKHDIKVTPGIEPGIKIIEW